MSRRTSITTLTCVIWLVIIVGTTTLSAQTGGTLDLTWNTLDGGGGTSSGGAFGLSGTIGQADAEEMSGGAFVLRGGFWLPAIEPAGRNLFLPLIVRQS